MSCQQQHHHRFNINYHRGPWTLRETAQLLHLVPLYSNNWARISFRLRTRNPRQCRTRYLEHLRSVALLNSSQRRRRRIIRPRRLITRGIHQGIRLATQQNNSIVERDPRMSIEYLLN